ncbi:MULTISPECIES: acyltransferase family protein [unclassified Brachybacterium]|uniref:acyltransferase family protein n=1 Tax=unclassified Brachybacterium TaxID=2623841 RepID=UPI0040338D97
MSSHPAPGAQVPPSPTSASPTSASRAAAPSIGPSPRLHHLDALRGGALLLGVLLHALMPFLPGGFWLVDDVHESGLALAAVGVIHLFRMVLFMMLAGYFGHMVLHRRGAGSYVRDRLLRIGLPLPTLGPILFVLMVGALVLNGVVRDLGPVSAPPADPVAPTGFLALPTMHLWFLLLLVEIALVVVAVRAVLVRVLGADRAGRLSGRISDLLASRAGLLVVAVPYGVGLIVQGDGIASITEPFTLVPVAGASIAYGGAFVAGWFLRSRPGALARVERRWVLHLVIAGVLTPVALLLPPTLPVVVAIAGALAGWAWVFGLLGLCARLVRREIPWVRYLADSSYWVYLLHFPLLLLAAVPLADLGLPVLVKLVLSLGVVMTVLLLSYDLLVRPTWIGRWLNGHRRPSALLARRRETAQPFTPPAAAKPLPRLRPRNR